MIKFIISRHPFVYGIIYLLLIPTYALIYDEMPRSFFHSTAKYEANLFYEKGNILNAFERDFKRYRGKLFGRDTINQAGSIMLIKYFEAKDFWIKDDYGNLLCNISVVKPGHKLEKGKEFVALKYDVIIRFYLLWGAKVIDHRDSLFSYMVKLATFFDTNQKVISKIGDFNLDGINGVWLDPKHDDISEGARRYYKFFDVNETNETDYIKAIDADSLKKNFVISEDLDQKIMDYFYAINGFPYGYRKSNFIRMLYFSSITIATVGYGDIVPITDNARLVVVSESILGLIFIGLFLNALAARIKSKSYS